MKKVVEIICYKNIKNILTDRFDILYNTGTLWEVAFMNK